METFSLLQMSLDQSISRESLEEASVAAPSVARADCARIQRDLFGLVVSGISREDALAFQSALAQRNFPTELIVDGDLPVLHESYQIHRVARRGEELVLTDSIGRERVRRVSDLVFLAAGFLDRLKLKTEWSQHLDFGTARGGGLPQWVTERECREQREPEFRMDFFFWGAPNRLNLSLGKESTIFHEELPLRLRDAGGLRGMMRAMAALLPPERLNSTLRNPETRRVYPSLPAYEEEIRWHFHRLGAGA